MWVHQINISNFKVYYSLIIKGDSRTANNLLGRNIIMLSKQTMWAIKHRRRKVIINTSKHYRPYKSFPEVELVQLLLAYTFTQGHVPELSWTWRLYPNYINCFWTSASLKYNLRQKPILHGKLNPYWSARYIVFNVELADFHSFQSGWLHNSPAEGNQGSLRKT